MKRCAVAVAATASPQSSISSALNLASLRSPPSVARPSASARHQRRFAAIPKGGSSRFEKLLVLHGRQAAALAKEKEKTERVGEELEQLLALRSPKELFDHKVRWETKPPNNTPGPTDPTVVGAYVFKRAGSLARVLRRVEAKMAAQERELQMLRHQLGDSMGAGGVEGGSVSTRGAACPFLSFVDQKGGRWADKDTVVGCARTFTDPHVLTNSERMRLKRKAEISHFRRKFVHTRRLGQVEHREGREARDLLQLVGDQTEEMVREAVLHFMPVKNLLLKKA